MKKLLFLFAVLLTSVGAWAQVITAVGDAFDPTGLTVLNGNNTGHGDHYVMEVIKYKSSDTNTQSGTYLYTEDTKGRILASTLTVDAANNYKYVFNIYKTDTDKYKLWVNNQGVPSFTTGTGGFSIEQSTGAGTYKMIAVEGEEKTYMLLADGENGRYLMFNSNEIQVTTEVNSAMWVKIHKVTVKSSELVFDPNKKYYLVESSSNLFVGKDANNKARLYSDFNKEHLFKVSVDTETGCHAFQLDDYYLYAANWEAVISSTKCVWSVEDVDADGYFTLHFTGDANDSNRQTGFLGTTSATNGQQLYSNQTHYQGKIMRFRLVEEDQVQNVTYKFKDDSDNLLATKTLTAIGTYPDASMFLKVPSDAVTMQGAPTGLVYGEQTEFDITVSYKAEFPFVPTTIVGGEFAEGTKWYNMTMREKKKRLKNENGNIKINKSFNDQDDSNQYFAFSGDAINGFKLHNRSVGASKSFSVAYSQEKNYGSFSDDGVALELFRVNNAWQLAPIDRTNDNARLHDFKDVRLGCWVHNSAPGDAGSNITIFEVDIDGGKVVANFQFKLDGEVKYTESKEYYAGYDITLTLPPYVSHNIEKMPQEGGDIEVPWTYTGTFNYYPSFNEIKKWYYLKFDADNNYFLYHQDGADHIALDRQELKIDDLESHSWAFVGNPFDGYKIYNKATGENKILSSSTTMSGSEGSGTYPVLTATPVPDGNNELWYATPSGHATNGFFLGQKGYASNRLNNREYKKDNDSPTEYRLAYWTGGAGSGSTFVVEDAIPVRLTTDDKNPIYYALKTGRDWDSKEWWYNYDSSDGKISLTQFDGSDAQWWYFKGILVDNKVCVQLVPKSDNTKFMSYEGSGNGAEKIIAKPDETTGYTNTWRFAFKGGRYVLQTSDGSNYLSNNGGRNNGYINKMGLWSDKPDTDSGTALYIYETIPFELTDNAGNAYTGTSLYQLESLALTFTGSHTLALSNIAIRNTFTADVDFGFPVSKTDGSADVSVLISGWRGSKGEGYFKYYVDGTNVKVTSESPTSDNVRNFEWSIYPQLTGSAFTFTIKNIGTDKYIQTSATGEATAEGTVVVVKEKNNATSFIWETNNQFKIDGKNLRLSVSSSSDANQDLGVDVGHGGCNTWITNTSDYVDNLKSQYEGFFGYVGGYSLDEGEKFNAIDTYVKYLEFIETPKETLKLEPGEVFKIICKDSSRGYMVYSAVDGKGSEENVFLAGTSAAYTAFPSIDAEGVYEEWAYVTIDGKDYLFNVQKEKFISPQGEVVKFTDNGSAFVLESIQGPLYAVKFTDSGNSYLCLAPGHGALPVRAIGNIADDGNRFYLQKTNETLDESVLTKMSNLHYSGELVAWKEQNIAVLGYVGAYPATLQNEINAVENYSDIPAFEEEHVRDIIPLKEGYYYIKSVDLSKFAVNDNNGFRATADPASEKSANNIFRFVSNGDGKYKFQSFANGKYVTLRNADTDPKSSPSEIDEIFANGSSFSFEGSDFAQFKIKDENDKVMRHEGSDNSYAINYWSSDVKYWYLIQAPELPLTIHSTGYSTFSAAVDVEVPEGVTAYYAKEQVGGSHIRMYPITTIPANEGVVIKGTGSATVKFPIIANADALSAENLLKAHLNTEAVTPEDGNSVFVMATKNGETGFYPLSTTNNTIGGHKSYLEIPSISAARLSIVWDNTETGIFETEGGEQNAEIYDLTGRRLDKPAKGVNVIGGKLVIK